MYYLRLLKLKFLPILEFYFCVSTFQEWDRPVFYARLGAVVIRKQVAAKVVKKITVFCVARHCFCVVFMRREVVWRVALSNVSEWPLKGMNWPFN